MSPIHVSASLYLRVLCKIHVSGFISQHLYISGSSARSMSPDPYISIHMYLRILCKIHVFRLMSQHLCISGSSTRSYKIHVFGFMSQHLRISGSSARSMCPIHVLAFMSQHPCVSQDPLQDPCLRIHISAAIFISGSSTRSTSSDSCLSIFVSHGFSARSMSPDSCLSIHLYLRFLCKIHVSGFMSEHLCISGPSTRSMSSDSCLSIFVSQNPLQDPCVRFMS